MRIIFALLILFLSPALGSAQDLRIVVISDLNGSYGSVDYSADVTRAVDRIIQLSPDVVVSTGDMVAGQRKPHLSESQVRAMWRAFHKAVTDPLTRAGIPILVTPGNHDASAYSGFERERRIYRDEWAANKPRGVVGDWPFHYAVRIGGVRFISLDATTVGSLPRAQMRWLKDLGDDGGLSIAFSHLPLHPFSVGRETQIIGDPNLTAIFEEIGTDLHLSGHHHAFYPGSADDIAFVAQACLGGGPRALIGQSSRAPKGFTVIEQRAGRLHIRGHHGHNHGPVSLKSLPRRIGVLHRLDLRPTETVKAAE